MPDPEESDLSRLGDRIDALDASRSRPRRSPFGETAGASAGYRLLGTLVGGVLAGLGLGWMFDRFVGSAPFGLIAGLLVGTAVAVWSVAREAARAQGSGPPPGGGNGQDGG